MMRDVSKAPALAIVAIALSFSLNGHAANTDPFDFDYEIVGGIVERPALIFNDGEKTYIQPRAGQIITADGGHSEGPYVVIDGTPETITYRVAGHEARARWTKSNTFIDTHVARGAMDTARADLISNRLALIGTHSNLDAARRFIATMPVAAIVKAIVPAGWSGSAQKDVDLTGASSFETHSGENWLQALDRLMAQAGLYADVDFETRHVHLHRDPPSTAGSAAATALAGVVPTPSVTPPSAPAGPSMLARYFGAQAIRDADDSHTQIRFAQKPLGKLTFTASTGESLRPDWDDTGTVVTIRRAEQFVVSDGPNSVGMVRTAGTVYDFDRASPAHLESVFDEKGQTYFKFGESVIHATVSDVRHLGSGEQKGRYYRFSGMADQFIVNADGVTVNVTRRHEVKYTEQPTGTPATSSKTAMVQS